MTDTRTNEAIELMERFAQRTGLTSEQSPKRYLWTDAFAVCNYLGLARATGDQRYNELALKLVEQVHHTLGRHRDDDARTGWLSGLGEPEGDQHPILGGLRIGKELPERGPDEPFDSHLEWERDGQYFHYLGKWMHALDQITRATGRPRFNLWARELAGVAFKAFSYAPPSGHEPRRMVWKMSIDLSRAQVPSMGKHDPLDGYITSLQLAATASALPSADSEPRLTHETGEYARMIRDGDWSTDDPLGIGGLLIDAYRVQQLQRQGAQPESHLLENLLDAAITGLRYYTRSGELQQPVRYRLAFRELGLAIGLQALERLRLSVTALNNRTENPRLIAKLDSLLHYRQVADVIEDFWRDPANRQSETWTKHRDINEVMLATSLAPDGLLDLLPPFAGSM